MKSICYTCYLKPIIETVLAICLLIILSPLLLIISILIKTTSKGPILYTQYRTGKGGHIFKIYKFRTMHHHLCDDGKKQALHKDPRITSMGHILRMSYFDELPQLLNVIKGDMCLIGPRPHSVPMDHEYSESYYRYWKRYQSKPGITGWAQIHSLHGRIHNEKHMRQRIAYDIWYCQRMFFFIDCVIGYRTLCMVLRLR